MDMRKTLPQQITNDELKRRGGSYTGIVRDVVVKNTWNKYTREKVEQPHITFTDGYTLVPNMGIRRALIAEFGYESDGWRGKEITVYLEKFTSKSSGEVRWEKCVVDCSDIEDLLQ